MKVVILAGGLGTRLSEETVNLPKPLVEISGYPMLWHIMKSYSHWGFNDFIICCGYRGHKIKEYFTNYHLHTSDICVNLENNSKEFLRNSSEPWKITMIDTGLSTPTGNRLLKIKEYIPKDEQFMVTYGDGLSTVDIKSLLKFHNANGKIGTVTAIQIGGRFGSLHLDNNIVSGFKEKPLDDTSWVSGGFFVFNYSFFNHINPTLNSMLEKEPLESLVSNNELAAYRHSGFWQCMDTLRDKNYLEKLWEEGKAPWKLW